VLELWLPVLLVALWWLASRGSTSLYFPPLESILRSFRTDWLSAAGWGNLTTSLFVLVTAFALALLLGVGAGLLLGLARPLERATRPLLEIVRAIPVIALLPVFILMLGIGAQMRVTLVVVGAIWPILLNTIDGVRSTEPLLLDIARTYGLGAGRRLRSIILPAASPQIFAGARTALSISLIIMVVSETVGSSGGIGYFLLNAQQNFAISDMWGAIVMLGLLGYLLSMIFRLVERRVLRWHRLYTIRLDRKAI
jgi:ABC-type nitrate/sulfonate/bicarbonate transport system permease component